MNQKQAVQLVREYIAASEDSEPNHVPTLVALRHEDKWAVFTPRDSSIDVGCPLPEKSVYLISSKGVVTFEPEGLSLTDVEEQAWLTNTEACSQRVYGEFHYAEPIGEGYMLRRISDDGHVATRPLSTKNPTRELFDYDNDARKYIAIGEARAIAEFTKKIEALAPVGCGSDNVFDQYRITDVKKAIRSFSGEPLSGLLSSETDSKLDALGSALNERYERTRQPLVLMKRGETWIVQIPASTSHDWPTIGSGNTAIEALNGALSDEESS